MTTRSLAAALVALALAGCRENLASIETVMICAPPEDAVECGTSGTCEAVLASPRLTVFTVVDDTDDGLPNGFTNKLLAFIQVDNQLPDNADASVGRVNTNDFVGGSYLIHYRGIAGVADVVFPANFTVRAESSSTPVVPVIPTSAMIQMRTAIPDGTTRAIVAELRIRGQLIDGSELETGVFEVAVDVIDDVVAPLGCTAPTEERFFCPNVGQTASSECDEP